ncbi:MAG: nucleotide sugar dehydrogenase [Actinomycetota bacterium]
MLDGDSMNVALLSQVEQRRAVVAVIGLGYVGLPLATRAAEVGFDVVGLDTNQDRVADLNTSGLGFKSTTDSGSLSEANVIVICVPTPLKQDLPDMSFVEAAAKDIASNLQPGQLVILESTTYPGTTEELLLPILETSGLKAGIDFFLGYSPERIDPGNELHTLTNVPKIVGGIDETSTKLMEAFYGAIVDEVVTVSSPRTAEMTKLLENTYRHVNIALVNEMAILCHDLGIDIWEVVGAAATKPFGFQPFYPGPGWGGHCIPVDPAYLSWRVRQIGATARFIELAREFNQKMPAYVVQRAQEALNEQHRSLKGATVLVLGVTYKADVADTRESPAIEIIERLIKAGAQVNYNDPLCESLTVKGTELASVPLDTVATYDLVLLHTAHETYDWSHIAASARLILDTRNALSEFGGHVVKL